MRNRLAILAFLFTGLTQAQDTIQLQSSVLETEVLVEGLTIPWDMNWGPDGWIWFNERDGDIFRLNPNSKELELIHTIQDTYESWDNSGFHAFKLHPRFPLVPHIYAHYTHKEFSSKLVRLTYDFQDKTLMNPVVLLDSIPGNSSHNGSRIIFDANDNIIISMGDAFNSQEAQNLNSLSGKILCLDPTGEPCANNPIEGNYMYSYGHRNPQGLCYGRDSLIYSSEHGEATDDELNLILPGKNYGWPIIEGDCDQFSEMAKCDSLDLQETMYFWTPTSAPCGLAYFDHEAIPEWRHSLIQTFLKDKRISVLPLTEDGLAIKDRIEWQYFTQKFGRIRDVLVAPNGRVFICTSNQETNGQYVTPDNYDKIIEIKNVDYDYELFIPEINSTEAHVFPNPATDHIWISVDTRNTEVYVELRDMKGALILSQTRSNQVFDGLWQVVLSGVEDGLYTLMCRYGQETLHQKIVISKEAD